MDKTKEYIIEDTLNHDGSVSEGAQHRIGRVGRIIRLTVGMSLHFLYKESQKMLRTSKVKDITEENDLVKVHTLNTIYVLKVV